MQFLKQDEQNNREEHVNYIEKLGRNIDMIAKLEQENKSLQKQAFDSIVRKAIDMGVVYVKCNHRKTKELDQVDQKTLTRHMMQLTNSWEGDAGLFKYQCTNCLNGVNIHHCENENETYYFTCDEARVINNLGRQYGIRGSIQTATRVRD